MHEDLDPDGYSSYVHFDLLQINITLLEIKVSR